MKKKTLTITYRLDENELCRIDEAYKEQGFDNRTDFIRHALTEQINTKSRQSNTDHNGMIRRIDKNINLKNISSPEEIETLEF